MNIFSKYLGIEKSFASLVIFIPLSIFFSYFTQYHALTFIAAILAILPIARMIGSATKELALQSNPFIGGLLSVTFGNIIELIIALLLLQEGLVAVVQASIIGSIIGNILLLIGLSIFFGGIRYKEQTFNKDSVGVSSTMLIIAVTGLAIPTVYAFTENPAAQEVQFLSIAVAIILALIYVAGLIFAVFTHKHLFDASDELQGLKERRTLSRSHAFILLLLSTLVGAFESHILVGDIEAAALGLGLSQAFIGVVIIAIVSNIAEIASSVHFARKNKLDVALEIGLSGAIQIALFVVPILLFASHILDLGFSLQFTLFEIISVFFAIMIVNYLSSDGKCNWLEGAQLISVYLIIAIAYAFI